MIIFLSLKWVSGKLNICKYLTMMYCPEMSGIGFPSLCSREVCLLWMLNCMWGRAKILFVFYIFWLISKHGAICQTILECTLATIFELWVNVLILLHHALQYIKLEIHTGPNLLGNYKAYISSVFKRCRFCSSTVLWGKWQFMKIWWFIDISRGQFELIWPVFISPLN